MSLPYSDQARAHLLQILALLERHPDWAVICASSSPVVGVPTMHLMSLAPVLAAYPGLPMRQKPGEGGTYRTVIVDGVAVSDSVPWEPAQTVEAVS